MVRQALRYEWVDWAKRVSDQVGRENIFWCTCGDRASARASRKSETAQVKDGASSFKPPGGPPALTVLTAKCTFKRARLPGRGGGAGVWWEAEAGGPVTLAQPPSHGWALVLGEVALLPLTLGPLSPELIICSVWVTRRPPHPSAGGGSVNLLVGGRRAGGAPGVSPVGPSSSSVLFREACGARERREGVGGQWEGESFWRCLGFWVTADTAEQDLQCLAVYSTGETPGALWS